MLRSRYLLAALAILGTALAPLGASADASVHVYAIVYQNWESSPLPPPVNRDQTDAGPGPTFAADTVTLHSDGPSARTAGGAAAIAREGTLWLRADGGALVKTGHYDSQGNAYMPSQGAWADAESRAAWSDTVTISDPTRTGQRGSALASVTLRGAADAGSGPLVNVRNPDGSFLSVETRGYGRVSIGGNGLAWSSQTWDDACAAFGWSGWLACANAAGSDPNGTNNYAVGAVSNIPVVLDFTFGQAFSLGYTLYANAGAYGATSYYKMASSGEGTGVGTLTLEWGGISGVFDASNAPVSGYAMSSESGFDYASPAPVPEPATGAMLLAGSAVLAMVRRPLRRW